MQNDQLKELRLAAGLTQEQVSRAVNVTLSAFCRWETGHAAPSVKYLAPLAVLYGVSLDKIVGCFNPQKAAGNAMLALHMAIAFAMLVAGLLVIELTLPSLGSF